MAEESSQATQVTPLPKNWPSICEALKKCRDKYSAGLIRAIALCQEPELLQKLGLAFPEFFSKEPVELRIPRSVLVEANQEITISSYKGDAGPGITELFDLRKPCELFGIPIAKQWSGERNDQAPEDVCSQLDGQYLGAGMHVRLGGQPHIAIYVDVEGSSMSSCGEYIGELILVDAKYIDLTC